MASIGRLLLALIIVKNPSFHMVYSDSMAIHGLRNESIFPNSNLGTLIVYQFLSFLSLYLLHSNKFFFNKSESIWDIKKYFLWLLLSFSWRIGWEIKKTIKNSKSLAGIWTHTLTGQNLDKTQLCAICITHIMEM